MKPSNAERITLNIELTLWRGEDGLWHTSSVVNQPFMDGWPEDSAEFGRAVRVARLSAGISLVEFSAAAGLTTTQMANIETAKARAPAHRRNAIVSALKALCIEPDQRHTPTEKS